MHPSQNSRLLFRLENQVGDWVASPLVELQDSALQPQSQGGSGLGLLHDTVRQVLIATHIETHFEIDGREVGFVCDLQMGPFLLGICLSAILAFSEIALLANVYDIKYTENMGWMMALAESSI